MAIELRAKLVEYRDLAPEVRHFVFEAPDIPRIEFVPGQFFSFTEELGGKKITRAYSVASPPDGNRIELCLNRVEEGLFSPHLFALQPGDIVQMKGPYGAFVWRKPMSDSLLVATGTGIAPFRSMLLDCFGKGLGPSQSVTLLFGVRYEENLFYRADFEQLARHYPNFRFRPTLSRPGAGWQGLTGRVQQHLMDDIGGRRDIDVYICGLRAMVDDVRGRLKDLGFDRKRIIYEKYD